MAERFVGIDVALREHRIAVLDRDGEAVGASFTIAANQEGVAMLLQTLAARGATAAQTLIGLEASGHLWENLEAALVGAGYRVLVLNPLQTRRYRDVVRRKAKTDDIDAHLIAGLLRSGVAQASYVPDEQVQSLRELARLRARLLADRQDYLRQLIAQLDVVLSTGRPSAICSAPGPAASSRSSPPPNTWPRPALAPSAAPPKMPARAASPLTMPSPSAPLPAGRSTVARRPPPGPRSCARW